jgi:pimeloyl-ACP methyl ester carboxylesterase
MQKPHSIHGGIKIESKIKETKSLNTPTVFFPGDLDRVSGPPVTKKMSEKFVGPFERIVVDGVKHLPAREAPELVGKWLVRHFTV